MSVCVSVKKQVRSSPCGFYEEMSWVYRGDIHHTRLTRIPVEESGGRDHRDLERFLRQQDPTLTWLKQPSSNSGSYWELRLIDSIGP